ncbi:MAG: hypothetical protein M3144_08080 [Actinomycetota bacterium]|nr:hypothetical protein [Actinomycetota bacterium]
MTLLVLLLVLVAVMALVSAFSGPSWYGRRPTRRVVEETVYDEPVEVIDDVHVDEVAVGPRRPPAPRHRRRRVIEY